MSAAELIDQWRRLHAELDAAHEQLKVQKKRIGELRDLIIQAFRQHGIYQVELPDRHVLQVRSEVGGKAKKPVQIAGELNELLVRLSMKDATKRSRTVDEILQIAFGKNPVEKFGLHLMPPQHSNRILTFAELA